MNRSFLRNCHLFFCLKSGEKEAEEEALYVQYTCDLPGCAGDFFTHLHIINSYNRYLRWDFHKKET